MSWRSNPTFLKQVAAQGKRDAEKRRSAPMCRHCHYELPLIPMDSSDLSHECNRKRRVQVVDAASYEDACAAQREVTCVHFTGTSNTTCRAGVAYESVRMNEDGGASVFACVQDEAWEARGRPVCAKYERSGAQ